MAFHRLGHRPAEIAGIIGDAQQDVLLVEDADDPAVLQHRQLRNVVQLHALVGVENRLVGVHRGDRVLAVAARDQVAQVAEALALDEALVEHPVIVVHLGEVLVAAVADQGDDALRRRLLAAVAQRGGDQRARGGTCEDAFLAQ